MFDLGWQEMLVVAIVLIVVVGPKDLPKMLRAFGRTTSQLRAMAGDFRKQFDEAMKEAELDDVKKSVESLRGLNPSREIKKHLNPMEKAAADVKAGLDAAIKPGAGPVKPKNGDAAGSAAAQTAGEGAAKVASATPPAAASGSDDPVAATGSATARSAARPARSEPAKASRSAKSGASAASKPSNAATRSKPARPAGDTAGRSASAAGAPGKKARGTKP